MVNLRNPLAEQEQTQAFLLHHQPGQITTPRLRELIQSPLGCRQQPINAPQRQIGQFSNLAPTLINDRGTPTTAKASCAGDDVT